MSSRVVPTHNPQSLKARVQGQPKLNKLTLPAGVANMVMINPSKAKVGKIVGRTLGMTVGVHLITDGKTQSDQATERLGKPISLTLASLFLAKLAAL